MQQHLLSINLLNGNGEITHQQDINLNGNYVIGRLKHSCNHIALIFEHTTTVVSLSQASRRLSSFHSVICEEFDTGGNYKHYLIVDGWGSKRSTNGIYVNSFDKKVDAYTLKHGDVIYLGCKEVILKYFIHPSKIENEKETLS